MSKKNQVDLDEVEKILKDVVYPKKLTARKKRSSTDKSFKYDSYGKRIYKQKKEPRRNNKEKRTPESMLYYHSDINWKFLYF